MAERALERMKRHPPFQGHTFDQDDNVTQASSQTTTTADETVAHKVNGAYAIWVKHKLLILWWHLGDERRAAESIAVNMGGVDDNNKGAVDAKIQRVQVSDQEATLLGGLTFERDMEGGEWERTSAQLADKQWIEGGW